MNVPESLACRIRKAWFELSFFVMLTIVFGLPVPGCASVRSRLLAESPASIRAEISKAYSEVRAMLENEDEAIREVLLTFERVLPGSGPQRLRGRYFFTESQREVEDGVRHIAALHRAELSFNVAASELRYDILWIDDHVRFIHETRMGPRDETEDESMEHRFYFSEAGQLVLVIEGAPDTRRSKRQQFTADDKLLARNARRLADRAGAAFRASIEIPGSINGVL